MRARFVSALASLTLACTPRSDLDAYSSAGAGLQDRGASAGAGAARDAATGAPGGGGNVLSGTLGAEVVPAALQPAGGGEQPRVQDAGVQSTGAPVTLPDNSELGVATRFARLVADSAVNSTPYTSIAEFDLLGSDGTPVDRSAWVVEADSAEVAYEGGAAARFATDGDPGTMWHTPWSDPNLVTPHPHFFQVDMGQPRSLTGFRYLPRQDASSDGRIAAYRFYVSDDGIAWGQPLATGVFQDSTDAQQATLPR